MKTILYWSILSVFAVVGFAGNLDPTDPPGPTMKTLDQVEPRIPIPGSDTPVGVFAINESGSYYLTGDRYSSSSGITVDANDVTIDLMGYSLIGPDSGNSTGVDILGRSNVEVRNGTVRDFGRRGIYENYSVGQGHRIINVRVISNVYSGIRLFGDQHLVKDCTVADNGFGHSFVVGISTGAVSVVTGNVVYNNGISATGNVRGILTGAGSTITGNTVSNNGDNGAGEDIRGIYAANGCTVVRNTVFWNGKNATSITGDVYGIYLDGASLVDQNTAYSNGDSSAGTAVNMNAPGSGTITASNYAP